MKRAFAIRNEQRVVVLRPQDPVKARLEAEQWKAQAEQGCFADAEASQAAFQAILATQPYTFVGYLAVSVSGPGRLLDEKGWTIGQVRPWDSFVSESIFNQLSERPARGSIIRVHTEAPS